MKKIYLTLLCGLIFATNLNAKQTWEIGIYPINSSVIATLHNDTLTISGGPVMINWSHFDSVPWADVRQSIRTIIIGNNIQNIGNFAFNHLTNLTSVTIANSMTFAIIGAGAFHGCTNLTFVDIPNSVLVINAGAFANTGITTAVIPRGVTRIESGLFLNAPLISVVIPFGVTTIGNVAFANTRLSSITILSGVPPIFTGTDVFLGLNKANVCLYVLPESVDLYRETDVWKYFNINCENISENGCAEHIDLLRDSISNLQNDNAKLHDSIGRLNLFIIELDSINEDLWDTIAWLRELLAKCNNNQTNIVGEHVGSPLQVFPNPVTNQLHITHDWQSEDIVELFDMNGRRVFAQPICQSSIVNRQFTIDMSPFPNGNYILRIGNRAVQIVKQ